MNSRLFCFSLGYHHLDSVAGLFPHSYRCYYDPDFYYY